MNDRLPVLLFVFLAAQAGLSPAAAQQAMTEGGMPMMATGIFLPRMDAAAGRQLFAAKGCVLCHSVNGVVARTRRRWTPSTWKR